MVRRVSTTHSPARYPMIMSNRTVLQASYGRASFALLTWSEIYALAKWVLILGRNQDTGVELCQRKSPRLSARVILLFTK